MDRISKLENLLEDFAEAKKPFQHLIPELFDNLDSVDKPLSLFSCLSFISRIESLRLGLFELAKIDEDYSFKILYRSLIEHMVKSLYLFLKTLESTNDQVGIDYWKFGQAQENFDFAKATNSSLNALRQENEELPIDIIKRLGAIPEDLSGSEIQRRLDQFKYKKMTFYLIEKLTGPDNNEHIEFFIKVFPRFSLLSSYVHGGPGAVGGSDPLKDDMMSIINESVSITLNTQKIVYLLCYQYKKEFESIFNMTQDYIEKHNNLSKRGAP